MSTQLFDTIKQLCDNNDISINKLEQTLGFGTSSITKWKTQSPSADKIAKVADYFDVTIEYLIGMSDTPYKISTTDDQDLLIIQRAREQLSGSDREKMMKLLRLTFENAFKVGGDGDDTI